MSVWKRSLASPRLHSAVGSSPNYDASTGCSASLCTPLCRPCRPRRADHRRIRRWSQGVRTVKATRGFLLFISFRHRTALDGSGCFYGSRLTHRLEAAWSNQPTRMAMRRRHRRPLCARPALVPRATACCATAAASTVAGGSYREEAQAMRSHRSKCCRHRRRRLYRQLPRLPPRRRRWLLHASVLLCLKQESSQLLLLLLWLLLNYVLLWYFYAAFYPQYP